MASQAKREKLQALRDRVRGLEKTIIPLETDHRSAWYHRMTTAWPKEQASLKKTVEKALARRAWGTPFSGGFLALVIIGQAIGVLMDPQNLSKSFKTDCVYSWTIHFVGLVSSIHTYCTSFHKAQPPHIASYVQERVQWGARGKISVWSCLHPFLAWSKLILNDYPVYGLAVYGLARGPGHRFHIKYLKLKVLGPFFQTAFTFRPQQIQTPGKQKSGRKCLKGVWRWTCQSKPLLSRNQAESASKGFGGGLARANPF